MCIDEMILWWPSLCVIYTVLVIAWGLVKSFTLSFSIYTHTHTHIWCGLGLSWFFILASAELSPLLWLYWTPHDSSASCNITPLFSLAVNSDNNHSSLPLTIACSPWSSSDQWIVCFKVQIANWFGDQTTKKQIV